MLYKKIKDQLSKIIFFLGINPEIIKNSTNKINYIPENKKAVCLISADFELAWAFRFSKGRINNPEYPQQKASIARSNIPKILKICDEFNIPITWATVGHLFLEQCKEGDHAHLHKLSKFKNQYWEFDGINWLADDPYSSLKEDNAWYAPDLIDMIQNSKVDHEIACHTFSHIDCSDSICSDEVFLSEINECKILAKKKNITLKSFVHPGHTIGNLENLANEGFTSFRTNYDNRLTYPKLHNNGLWEMQNTMELAFREGWSIKYHIYRYKKIIDRAIKNNKVCYLWFHPSMEPIFIESIMPEIFSYLNSKKDEVLISTTKDYVDWLNNRYAKFYR